MLRLLVQIVSTDDGTDDTDATLVSEYRWSSLMIPANASRVLAEASGGSRFNIGRAELVRVTLEVIVNINIVIVAIS